MPLTLKELIRKHANKKPDELLEAVMKCGYSKINIYKKASDMRRKGENIPYFTETPNRKAVAIKHPEVKSRGNSISVKDFIRNNDIFIIVLEAVKKIQEGDMYEEPTFIKSFINGKNNYRAALESEEIKPYRGRAGGRWYLGHPKDIKDLKQRGLLT